MKRLFLMLVLAVSLFLSSNSFAQKYFTYDGTDFSVLLTTDNSNARVTAVEFSANGKWVPFSITNYTDLEDVEGGGFMYTVLDGQGKEYTIDYWRTNDHIKVTNSATGKEWTLNRRDE